MRLRWGGSRSSNRDEYRGWRNKVLGDMGWEFPDGEGENDGKDWFRTKDENMNLLVTPIDTKELGRTKETKWNKPRRGGSWGMGGGGQK